MRKYKVKVNIIETYEIDVEAGSDIAATDWAINNCTCGEIVAENRELLDIEEIKEV